MAMNCDPVLVAPRPIRLMTVPQSLLRPVRLVTASDGIERVTSSLDELKVTDKEQVSPRSSPRSALPSEALEEFLSILKPFRPQSPIFARRQSTFAKGIARVQSKSEDESEVTRSTSPLSVDDADCDLEIFGSDEARHFRWFSSSLLSSPVSRMHTRNPFQRQRVHPISPAASPAAIPLPPSPVEMLEMS